jgi:hypothetical protein
MKFKYSHIVVALLMLLSQSAVAVHDVEHQGYEHSDQCRAFLGGEQSATLIDTASIAQPMEYLESFQPGLTSVCSARVALSFSPRAPPATT